jgi:uncharacterized sulfatase
MISFTDFAPTFLNAAGVKPTGLMTGRSLLNVFESGRSGRVDPARTAAYSGRERHSHARYDNLGFPTRSIRTKEYLYIRNFAADRWPMGDPDLFADTDESPSKQYILKNRERAEIRPFFSSTTSAKTRAVSRTLRVPERTPRPNAPCAPNSTSTSPRRRIRECSATATYSRVTRGTRRCVRS